MWGRYRPHERFSFNIAYVSFPELRIKTIWETKGRFGLVLWTTRELLSWLHSWYKCSSHWGLKPGLCRVVSMGMNRSTSEFQGTDADSKQKMTLCTESDPFSVHTSSPTPVPILAHTPLLLYPSSPPRWLTGGAATPGSWLSPL